MGDASQSAETPNAEAKTEYKLPLHALVPTLVANLASPGSNKPTREKAAKELTQYACSRLTALAGYIDHTAAAGKEILLDGQSGRIEKTLGAAIFQSRPAPSAASDFYQRASAAIREWLIARLDALADPSEESPGGLTATRLDYWREFHRNAANLPEQFRAVHDLMYYFRLTAQQTADTLGKPQATIEMDKDVAVQMLRPMFDRARGKA